jgi:hypothetical protein
VVSATATKVIHVLMDETIKPEQVLPQSFGNPRPKQVPLSHTAERETLQWRFCIKATI